MDRPADLVGRYVFWPLTVLAGLGGLVSGIVAALSWLGWLILVVGGTFFQDPLPTLGVTTWGAIRATAFALGCATISYQAQRRARRGPSRALDPDTGE